MGNSHSSDRSLYVDILKYTLKRVGIKANTHQLVEFLQFVQKVSPWFPEEGTLDEEIWDRVGKNMSQWYQTNGGKDMPIYAFSLWGIIKHALFLSKEPSDLKDPPSYSTFPSPNTEDEKVPLISKPPSVAGSVKNKEQKLSPLNNLMAAATHILSSFDSGG